MLYIKNNAIKKISNDPYLYCLLCARDALDIDIDVNKIQQASALREFTF